MGGRVVGARSVAPRGVDAQTDSPARPGQATADELADMEEETGRRLLRIRDLEDKRFSRVQAIDRPGVAHLTARFTIEGRAVDDEDVAIGRGAHDLSLGLGGFVAEELSGLELGR